MANRVILSPEYFPDPTRSRAISGGFIYVGIVDLDPKIEANQKQISVLQENGTTVEVAQPIETNAGGTPQYNGSPVTTLVDGAYSLRVDDKHGSQLYYVPRNAGSLDDLITFGTIEDLRNTSGSFQDQAAFLLGYDIAGDGGGVKSYIWDESKAAGFYIDNGLSIIVNAIGDGSSAWIWSPEVSQVNTIAQLRTKLGAYAGQPMNVLGYHEVGDGGGGPLRVLADTDGPYTDNGIDIIVGGGSGIGSVGDSAWVWEYSGEVNVKWGGAVGDGVITGGVINAGATDDTAALQALINRSTEAPWALYASPGIYLTTEELTVPEDDRPGRAFGINLRGDNTNWNDVSVIYAKHNGPAILSLKGSNGSNINGLKLVSDPGIFPKTGMILGRDINVDSCGWHNISNIWIAGNFSVAGIYSIASEENIWNDIFIYLTGGGAAFGFYTGISDALGVDSLPANSNVANSITKMNVWNEQAIAGSACIYIEGAQAVGSWSFTDCYCIPKSGSYYQINNGAIDGLSCLGPFTFTNCSGEIYQPAEPWFDTPVSGYKISTVANLNMVGLTILGSRCQLINAAGTRRVIDIDPALILVKPNIVIQPLLDPTITYNAKMNAIRGGLFDAANSGDWTGLAFNAPWANNFGVPYAQAAFRVSPDGILSLRGVVNNGSTGLSIIAQLPPGFEPGKILLFPTLDVLTNAIVQVSELGAISLTTGTGTQVNLNNISFKLVD